MRIQNLYPGSWGSNCYLLFSGRHAAVVDPSAPAEQILSAVDAAGAQLDMILLTHGHFDHIVSIDSLRELLDAPVLIHEQDADFPADPQKNGFAYFFHMNRAYRAPDRTFADGDILTLGEDEICVLHTPGHTQGSVCFSLPHRMLLTGDTLFNGNRGRTDLYGGNEDQLLSTLQAMRQWDPDQIIYPGHGDEARLGDALDLVLAFG